MNRYLDLAFLRLGSYIPFSREDLSFYFEKYDKSICTDIDGFHYLLFSWPVLDLKGNEYKGKPGTDSILERVITLVFDDDGRIIADTAAFACSLNSYLKEPKLLDELCDDGDWSYLEHLTLCGYYFPELEYPPCEHKSDSVFEGEVISLSNAYVTRAYRRRGIFRNMMELLEEFTGTDKLIYEVVSLDPDVACYGPDSLGEPYIYSFEKDEPVRRTNAEILRKMGFTPLKLEDSEAGENDDGTKLWFAVKRTLIYDIENTEE